MLAELALVAMLSASGSAPAAVQGLAAGHDTVVSSDAPRLHAPETAQGLSHGTRVALSSVGFAALVGGGALFLDGLKNRGYDVRPDGFGGTRITRRKYDAKMGIGGACALGGAVVFLHF